VSNLVVDIAYIATLASTLIGACILVAGVVFVVMMVRAFRTPAPEPVAERDAPDVYGALYRAALAAAPSDATPLSGPPSGRVTRPDGIHAMRRAFSKRMKACDRHAEG